MDLLGRGRTAEVFALDDETVVKIDRPGFDGLAVREAEIMREVGRSGVPVPAVIGTTEIDGRNGLVLERLYGPPLSAVIESAESVEPLAEAFVDLHIALHAAEVPSAPHLVTRLAEQVQRSGLPDTTTAQLSRHLRRGSSDVGTCHFDFHPDNVVVTAAGWRVIDWVDAAVGPTMADFARTTILRADATDGPTRSFMNHFRRYGTERRNIDADDLTTWLRVVAAARLAEGFAGPYASWLRSLAIAGD